MSMEKDYLSLINGALEKPLSVAAVHVSRTESGQFIFEVFEKGTCIPFFKSDEIKYLTTVLTQVAIQMGIKNIDSYLIHVDI